MARKPKAKRPGRPELPKAERREVLSVRLPLELMGRIKALKGYGAPADIVERALRYWLDEWEGRAHEILARQTDEE